MGNAFAVRFAQRGRTSLVALGVVAVALTGCGSSSKSPAASTSSAISASSGGGSTTASNSLSATGSASATDDCGGVVARVKTAVASFTQVTKVDTIAACHEVDIQTNLPSGVLGSPSATTGAQICDAAATVAYQGDVSSITVTATDGHEIAAGLKSAPCIPG